MSSLIRELAPVVAGVSIMLYAGYWVCYGICYWQIRREHGRPPE